MFLSRFFSLTMFNIGYRLEHHNDPLVHWSKLPEIQQRLKKELIDGAAHVVPYGNYHDAFLLAGSDERKRLFAEQEWRYANRHD